METMEHHYAVSVLVAVGVGVCVGVIISRFRSGAVVRTVKNEAFSKVQKDSSVEPVKKKTRESFSNGSSTINFVFFLLQFGLANEKFKSVFAVRQDVKMTPGKIAAQVSRMRDQAVP